MHRPLPNAFVNLAHQPDGFAQGDHNLLVVLNVVVSELAAFAVLQPLLANLIAANVKFPNRFRNAAEVLPGVKPDALVVVRELLVFSEKIMV